MGLRDDAAHFANGNSAMNSLGSWRIQDRKAMKAMRRSAYLILWVAALALLAEVAWADSITAPLKKGKNSDYGFGAHFSISDSHDGVRMEGAQQASPGPFFVFAFQFETDVTNATLTLSGVDLAGGGFQFGILACDPADIRSNLECTPFDLTSFEGTVTYPADGIGQMTFTIPNAPKGLTLFIREQDTIMDDSVIPPAPPLFTVSGEVVTVPEPTSLSLISVAFVGLFAAVRKKLR
jgi:hypothetical protein